MPKNFKAIGPDGIATVMLKHLGEHGINYLTKTFNICLQSLEIPDMRKQGKIILIPKPGKPSNQGSSYRPITLLSPVVKILEAMILPFLKDHLPRHEHQHGFRAATTALCEISTFITEGLNSTRPAQRSVLVALDISKAFDMVDHAILLKDI